jgi:histidyl-tRNA synthetase
MGWAAGVERMLLAGEERPVPEPVCDLYVALGAPDPELRRLAFALTAEARRAQVPAQLELAGRSLKGQMKQAGRLGARYVAILGEAGIELKDMESGEQAPVASGSAAVASILRGRHG